MTTNRTYAEALMTYENVELAIATAMECCVDAIEDDRVCKTAYFFEDNSIFVVSVLNEDQGYCVEAL